MAGIGFTLRRMLGSESLFGPFKAFGAALVLATGPWLSASMALALLGALSVLGPGTGASMTFLALVSHAFAWSLLSTGLVQMAASRFMADRLYADQHEDLGSAFWQLLLATWAVQAIGAGLFLAATPLPPVAQGAGVVLVLALGGIWLAMTFLSAARRFGRQLAAFALGSLLAAGLGLLGAAAFGLAGQVAGFAAGQVLTCLVLMGEVERTFGAPRLVRVGLWSHIRRHKALLGIGVCYNAGIWVDKWLFWQHPTAGVAVAGVLRASPVYDEAMFMAYLTVLPALALFLIQVETDLSDHVRGYFATIEAQRSLAAIESAKASLARSMRRGLARVVQLQGVLTIAVLLLAPDMVRAMGLGWFPIGVFRAGVLSAFVHVLQLIVLVMLLYLDLRRSALALAALFLVSNALATQLAFAGGLPFFGFGVAIANLVSLSVGLILLEWGLHRFEYHVFFRPAERPRHGKEARS
ncbi:MAG: exopolysaccharide Pel transporter PelG [Candidatus Sericytochromatia bacterium]